jgi:hypothetical protein
MENKTMNPKFKQWLKSQKYDYVIKDGWKVKLDDDGKTNFKWDNIIAKYIISEKIKILFDKRNESKI